MTEPRPTSWALRLAIPTLALSYSLGVQAAPRAFPSAEGFGALVTGGRGGSVVHVTNLNDSGAGSLRDALSKGNRIVVFDVGGLISIASQLVVQGDNVTVAGQTAPGPGITIYGDGSSASNRKNVILRYLRFRQGYDSASGTKALNVTDGSNMIFDHLSVQWGRWDTIGITGDSNTFTIQYSLLGESIDPQRFGGLIDSADKVTLSHNLWLDSQSRSPKFKANGQYINNVVYNWGANGLGGGHSGADWYQDLINNFFIKGPSSSGGFATGFASTDHVFHRGDLADLDTNGTLLGRAVVDADFQGDTPPTFESAAHNTPPIAVTVESTTDAYAHVIASAGASLCRDAVDQRLVGHVTSLGTKGAIIVNESLVGGQPAVTAVSRPANFDTDRDGIADAWESAHGLDPASAADAAADPDGDGYSNLETYLNELGSAAPGSCGAASPVGGSGGATASTGGASGSTSKGGSAGQTDRASAGEESGGATNGGGAPASGGATSAGAPSVPSGGASASSGASSAGTGGAEAPTSAGSDSSGCGCRIVATRARSQQALLLALVAFGFGFRRRRGARRPRA